MSRRMGSTGAVAGGVLGAAALVLSVSCSSGALGGGGSDLPAASPAVQQALDFASYRENIEPIFLRDRGGFVPGQTACMNCHTWQATTPLKLARPQLSEDGQPYWTESQSRQNFAVVSRLVRPGEPGLSRLLLKPLAAEAGGNGRNHTGGTFWTDRTDPEYQTIARWVESAPRVTVESPPLPDFAFFRQCVQPIFINPTANAMACTECHSGTSNRGFANPFPEGRDYWTEEESQTSYAALMNLIEPGYPEYSRLLHHPLHPDAGGDFMHNGGRRWLSKQDPEWRALASWIRGEARGTECPPALQFPRRG